MLVFFMMVVGRGQSSIVEHFWFLFISLCLIAYAPFWLSNAINTYEEQVQEVEISAIDQEALRCLDRMSIASNVTPREQEETQTED